MTVVEQLWNRPGHLYISLVHAGVKVNSYYEAQQMILLDRD